MFILTKEKVILARSGKNVERNFLKYRQDLTRVSSQAPQVAAGTGVLTKS